MSTAATVVHLLKACLYGAIESFVLGTSTSVIGQKHTSDILRVQSKARSYNMHVHVEQYGMWAEAIE